MKNKIKNIYSESVNLASRTMEIDEVITEDNKKKLFFSYNHDGKHTVFNSLRALFIYVMNLKEGMVVDITNERFNNEQEYVKYLENYKIKEK